MLKVPFIYDEDDVKSALKVAKQGVDDIEIKNLINADGNYLDLIGYAYDELSKKGVDDANAVEALKILSKICKQYVSSLELIISELQEYRLDDAIVPKVMLKHLSVKDIVDALGKDVETSVYKYAEALVVANLSNNVIKVADLGDEYSNYIEIVIEDLVESNMLSLCNEVIESINGKDLADVYKGKNVVPKNFIKIVGEESYGVETLGQLADKLMLVADEWLA